MSAQEEYAARLKRVDAAVALEKGDRVPLMPFARNYPYRRQGHTVAEAMYDAEMAAGDMKRFALDFEPDLLVPYTVSLAGAGQVLEALGLRFLEWPGREGGALKENAAIQIIEQTPLDEDGYEDLAETYLSLLPAFPGEDAAVAAYARRAAEFEREMAALGFPMAFSAATAPAYDVLSICLRGTLGLMMDLYTQEDEVQEALALLCPLTVDFAARQAARWGGRFVYVPLMKGMEGYLGLAQYEEFYFPTLKTLTEGLIARGLTPVLYAEGPYNDRMELLSTLPRGVVFHMDSVDMARAKQVLGKEHCLSGGFYAYDLIHSNPGDIETYLKSLLDTVAVDGGYIFDFGDKLDEAEPRNIETMFRVLRDYGTY
ncbi:MAG: uroporphyrinogen decarboxylase family protein [Oscillospiraceae bacterium]|nr:uroporphyrinogen decarboxylase family protein [bacterium]MDY5101455.1 uroporphyrinogen decarboxylase family protein [Oscillospiraceae bacterium]